MDRAASSPQGNPQGDSSAQRRPHPYPQPKPATESGATLIAAQALVGTVRHFFPQFNDWLGRLPDTRAAELCTYSTEFLAWWGIWLYLAQLGSRRQLDFELRDGGPQVLANLNRLAQTKQLSLPVHDTLDHFLGHVALGGWEQLRAQMVQRLLRMKALDNARLLGRPVLLLDATGLICFHRRHCPDCLTQRQGGQTLYLHQVLEAKLLGPCGVVISLDSEFIDNADAAEACGRSVDKIKQDCELKALTRLLPRIKQRYPQLPFVLALDSLYGVGPVFALLQELGWSFVVTFKEGRTPALWQEYQTLKAACPDNVLKRTWRDGPEQEFRWVSQLSYLDSQGRSFTLDALECTETVTPKDGEPKTQYFAWLTGLAVNRRTVEEIAQKGGRARWTIENEGFNRQKNSGLNLEHVYSIDPENWKSYYVLLQIAFIVIQLLERGSLLRRLAAQAGRAMLKLFGSLKNVARRLLEGLRNQNWDEAWFNTAAAGKIHISLDST
jgi:hypothetical protein